MKTLKRVFSSVLVLIMMIGMIAMPVNAVTYTDDTEIEYKEAVAVVTGIGLFKGDAAGAFNPHEVLTRAEIAVLLTRITVGSMAGKLVATKQIFSDVPTTHWAAAYIEYCYNVGLMNGSGNGNFNPDSKLTGIAFAKLLLGVLGYDADAQGYVGTNWNTNIIADSLHAGLTIEGVNINAELTREVTAQMILQAMDSKVVCYQQIFDMATGEIILVGPMETGETFAEKYFPNLVKEIGGYEMWGRPPIDFQWKYQGELIYTAVTQPLKVYTTAVFESDIAEHLGLTADVVITKTTLNNTPTTVNNGELNLSDTETKIGAQGRLTEIYSDGSGGLEIVMIDTFLTQVVGVTECTYASNGILDECASLTLYAYDEDTDSAGEGGAVCVLYSDEDWDYTVGEWLLVNYDAENDEPIIVGAPETLTGAQTAIILNKGTRTREIGDVEYNDAHTFYLDEANKNFTQDYTWFFDQYGNLIGAVEPSKENILPSTPVQLDICDGSISIVSTEDTVTYTQGENVYTSTGGCIVTQTDTSAPTANRIDISSDSESALLVKLTIASLNMEANYSPIALDGAAEVTLTLTGSNVINCTALGGLNLNAGILVAAPSILTITGQGELTAIGGVYGAGIGGGYRDDGGTITITSGTVTATGGEMAAGIGGGRDGSGGTIHISDGTVAATGGRYGAGIGSGGYYVNGGSIAISGGIVSAVGGEEGAGIGGGLRCDGGTITITGGTVIASCGETAFSDYGAAGIGGGTAYGIYGKGGNISISNAKVSVKGHCYAIGGGDLDNKYGCDSILIGENSILDLSYSNSNGSTYQERIDINTQPLPAATHSGNSILLTTDAYGYSGTTYQWQAKTSETWMDLEGYTSAIAYIPITEENAGSTYRCKITNAYGNTVYTEEVQSHILAFAQQPESVETNLDEIAALSVTSSCSNVTYQWQRSYDGVNWADVDNQTSPTLVVTTTLSENGAFYRCIIIATNGDWLASDPAQIVVNTNAVTYSTDYYLEQADGSYTFAERVTTAAETGAIVSATTKTYAHYVENTIMGSHSGTVTSDSGLVLSRYYDRCEYTLTFEVNGGSAVTPIKAKHGAAVELPSTLSRYGYVFDGWFLDEDLTEEALVTAMPTEDTTIYAKWAPVGADRGTEYRINGITILGQDYQEETTIPTGSFYAQVSVTNLCSETVDTLILAAYDENGKMLDFFFLYADPQVEQTFLLGALINNADGEIAKLRAYMIPMLGGPMVPLANSVSTVDS